MSLEPLQPLLPMFSSAISRALALFQLLDKEEVSCRAQPDDIYSTEAGNPPHPVPRARTLPFGVSWLCGDSLRGHGSAILARHRPRVTAVEGPGGSALCSCADAAASCSKY